MISTHIVPKDVKKFIDQPGLELIGNPIKSGLGETFLILLKRYANSLRLLEFSRLTIVKYTQEAAKLLLWLSDTKSRDDISLITAEDVREYARLVLSQKKLGSHKLLNPKTRCVSLASIKHFFTHLFKKEVLSTNFSPYIEMPRVEMTVVRDALSLEDIQKLINLPTRGKPIRLRNKAIVELMYSTGIRNSELRNIKVEDINFKENQILIRKGKGGRPRLLPIGLKAINAIEEYLLVARPRLLTGKDPADTLFVPNKNGGTKLTIWTLPEIIQRMAKEAGIKKRITPHMLRHSFATHMLNNDCDIRYIQTFLGHKRITTTEIYTHSAIDRLKEIHQKTHPLENHA